MNQDLQYQIKQKEFSYLGRKGFIRGDLNFESETYLNSTIEGNITMEGEHPLVIEPEAKIKGQINSHNLDIYGSFDGEISSKGKVSLYPNCAVKGQIKAMSVEIYPGANFQGDCHTLL